MKDCFIEIIVAELGRIDWGVGKTHSLGGAVRQPLEASGKQCIETGGVCWDARGKMESPGLRNSGRMGGGLRGEWILG